MSQQLLNRTKQQIKFKAGVAANINATATKNLAVEGEPHFTTDTDILFVFDGSKNVPVAGRTNVTTLNAATYSTLAEDHIIHVTYTATAAVTALTLPTAQTKSGRLIIVKDAAGNAATNNITIDTQGSETIDGAATYVINTNYGKVTLYSDGSNWYAI